MSNMALEDLLETLAHWGSLTVRRNRFPSAASPGLKGRPVEWHVEIRIPGYANKYGQPRFEARGANIREIAELVYAETEAFLFSEEGRSARKKHVDERNRHNEYAARTNPENLSHHGTAARQLGEPVPDVTSADVPTIEIETYQ